MDLPGRVHGFAQQHGLWSAETPVIAAVSGGADSVALLLVLDALARQQRLRLAGVAHLHHHVRGAAADADAAFVRDLAGRLGLAFQAHDDDVPARARRHRQSIEVAGRQARLEFFDRLAAGPGLPRIALAHTRTDQAETVLLRLARGAGPRGLAGMAPRTLPRVRPLLEESRDTLRAWLRDRGQAWREDDTNSDTTIARNLVRLDILPRLARLNPGVEAALARAARIQRADAEVLDALAEAEASRLVEPGAGSVRFSMGAVRRLPEGLARRVVRLACLRVHPGRTPSWDDTEAILHLAGNRLEVGAVCLELFGDLAVLSTKGRGVSEATAREPEAVELLLTVPGSVRHPRGWWTLAATGPVPRSQAGSSLATGTTGMVLPDAGSPPTAAAAQVVLDAGAVGRHLTIRGWRPGDRVQPLGLAGRKKVQDVFVDRKVPRDERALVPIVVDGGGRIVWVAGHVVGEPFRVTPHSEAVVVLTLRR